MRNAYAHVINQEFPPAEQTSINQQQSVTSALRPVQEVGCLVTPGLSQLLVLLLTSLSACLLVFSS